MTPVPILAASQHLVLNELPRHLMYRILSWLVPRATAVFSAGWHRCGLAVLLGLSIAGCNTPGAHLKYPSIEARQADLIAFDTWRAGGRLSLSNSTEGFSAALNWQQARTDFDLTLTAILGQRALHVRQAGGAATLSARGRPTTTGTDAELLIRRELGVRVPLQQLAFWVRGLPGSAGDPVYDQAGRLQTLAYIDVDGTRWSAEFLRYQLVEALELPALINVVGEYAGDDYKIRLSLKDWSKGQLIAPLQPELQPQQQEPAPGGRLVIPGA